MVCIYAFIADATCLGHASMLMSRGGNLRHFHRKVGLPG